MPETQKYVLLYRVENPNIESTPNGITSHEELVGQWFSTDLDTATTYLRKSTQTFGRGTRVVDGAQLVIAHVPADELEGMRVSHHPVAANMDAENDNYLIPRDGTIPTDVLPLDAVVGDLRGRLGSVENLQEARRNIRALLGKSALK